MVVFIAQKDLSALTSYSLYLLSSVVHTEFSLCSSLDRYQKGWKEHLSVGLVATNEINSH